MLVSAGIGQPWLPCSFRDLIIISYFAWVCLGCYCCCSQTYLFLSFFCLHLWVHCLISLSITHIFSISFTLSSPNLKARHFSFTFSLARSCIFWLAFYRCVFWYVRFTILEHTLLCGFLCSLFLLFCSKPFVSCQHLLLEWIPPFSLHVNLRWGFR